MFKAKLIENKSYYGLRRNQLIWMILPAIPIGFVVNFYTIPIWVTILMIVLYISIIMLMIRNQKRINSVLGKRIIEIDTNEIRIKSKKGTAEETINLNEIEKIILKDEYSIPQETIKNVGEELTGKLKQNYLILQARGQDKKLEFEIDSYYMLEQLNKLITAWKTKGYSIEMVNQT